MKQNSLHQPTRHDDLVLRSTLLKLTASQKILCTVVIAVVALVWYDLLNKLVAFGDTLDYSGLHAFGVQAVEFIKRYNPFFWWAVVVLCTVIIAYLLYGFVQSTQRKVRGKLVTSDTLSTLVDQLSEPALEVLRWVWDDHRHPITVGVLQRTATELRNRRASKINLAREHAALLDPSVRLPNSSE
ncbi:MAG TPA: hypothetical protein VIP51_01190 [Eoetvoesiella sp.]